ncbi:MAG: adenylyl-sulfate kinase [Chitinophagales bacterium]
MNSKSDNIHPFNQLLPRESKEELLGQKGIVFWFTGLSGSGKSTIAKGLEERLHETGYLVQVLDGDNVRTGINNNLGFSEEDRKENIRRIAEVAKLFVNTGVVTICCFVSPTIEIRQQAKAIIGAQDFKEVFVNTPIEECEKRDVKGLYAKARRGEIKDFTGINAPFEAPVSPDLELKTKNKSVEESVNEALTYALPLVSRTS